MLPLLAMLLVFAPCYLGLFFKLFHLLFTWAKKDPESEPTQNAFWQHASFFVRQSPNVATMVGTDAHHATWFFANVEALFWVSRKLPSTSVTQRVILQTLAYSDRSLQFSPVPVFQRIRFVLLESWSRCVLCHLRMNLACSRLVLEAKTRFAPKSLYGNRRSLLVCLFSSIATVLLEANQSISPSLVRQKLREAIERLKCAVNKSWSAAKNELKG